MTTIQTLAEIAEQDGVLLREPRNLAANVAGSIHMEQFPPLLLRAFGQRWFETGSRRRGRDGSILYTRAATGAAI